MTPPVKDKSTPLTAPYRKDFSLTSGAKFLSIGKGTLRSAIERGDVKATKNKAGHYSIEGAQIFQYKQNLEADELKEVLARVSTEGSPRADTGVDTPLSAGVSGGASTGVDTSSGTGVSTPSDRRAGTVSRDMHQTVVEGLEARLRDKEGMIRDLKDSVDSWQTQAKSWQNHADNNLRLLTDERTKMEQMKPEIEAGQGSHVLRHAIAASALIGLVIIAVFFSDDLAQQWANLTAVDSSGTTVKNVSPKG